MEWKGKMEAENGWIFKIESLKDREDNHEVLF